MRKLTIKQKLGLICFGVFLGLAILEIGLRLSGLIILSLQEHRNKLALKEKGAYKIMCLGGSTTADGGEYSYPSQLEQILNGENIKIRFKVINKGIDGADSTFILSELRENLDKYNPDMAIVMMGENDVANTLPYDDTLGLQIKLFFRGFRICKITKLLCLRIVNKAKEFEFFKAKGEIASPTDNNFVDLGNPDFQEKKYTDADNSSPSFKEINKLVDTYMTNKNQGINLEVAEKAIKRAIEISPNDVSLYVRLGDCYTINGKFKEAEDILKKAIEIKPNDSLAHVTLAFCYWWEQGRYDQAEKELKKAIEIDPENARAYSDLVYCYEKQGKNKQIQELCESIIRSGRKNGFFYGFLARYYIGQGKEKEANKYFKEGDNFRLKYYNPVTRYNYKKLGKIITQKGIKLVCVQHAMRSVEPLKKMLDSVEGIIFVDNEKTFKDAIRSSAYGDYFRDCFAGDFGHCTPKGNRLLAENISKVILKEIFNW